MTPNPSSVSSCRSGKSWAVLKASIEAFLVSIFCWKSNSSLTRLILIFLLLFFTNTSFSSSIEENTKIVDKQLNGVYGLVLKKLPDPLAIKLRNAQRQWIKYRDDACGFEKIYFSKENKNLISNTFSDLVQFNCIKRITEQRVIDLELYLHTYKLSGNKNETNANAKHTYEYYDTGELRYVHSVSNGARNGPTIGYYKNGSIEGKWYFVNDKKHGTAVLYHENGAIKEVRYFENGKLIGE